MAIINVSDYTVKPTETFFFDTNVWIYLYAPVSEFDKEKQYEYSSLLEEIISRNAQIVINNLVIAEISNVLVRNRYKKYLEKNTTTINYKAFWRTSECKDVIEEIKIIIKSILETPNIQQIPDSFNSINLETSLYTYYGTLDYNDAFIIHLCKTQNYMLVSTDKDFDRIEDFNYLS